jgi:hypothetical protein
VILEFRDPASARLLDLIDGTRTEAEVLRDAVSQLRFDSASVMEILTELRASGVLVDAATLLPAGLPERARHRLLVEAAALLADEADQIRRRTAGSPSPRTRGAAGTPAEALTRRSVAKALVTGMENLVTPVAIALASAGVGHIAPVVAGERPQPDMISTLSRIAPETTVSPLRVGVATVIVRIGPKAPAVPMGRSRRAAVLEVTVRDGMIVVGPMLLPRGSPCGHCLDLHRRDRDPAWPVLAAQLATEASPADNCPVTTVLSAAALAAEEVLRCVDNRACSTQGAALEVRRPGEIRRRSWSTHPRCDCRHRRSPCDSG